MFVGLVELHILRSIPFLPSAVPVRYFAMSVLSLSPEHIELFIAPASRHPSPSPVVNADGIMVSGSVLVDHVVTLAGPTMNGTSVDRGQIL
jgi:hypothetical protein